MERTDQGICGDPDTRRRFGGPACEPSVVVWDPGFSGGPEVFICVVPWVAGRKSGGDEETRTPDPLLAKEMLCQLSYVPANLLREVVGAPGLEPGTSALSGPRSNQLSYAPSMPDPERSGIAAAP